MADTAVALSPVCVCVCAHACAYVCVKLADPYVNFCARLSGVQNDWILDYWSFTVNDVLL